MKKYLGAALIVISLFAISYGIASSVNAKNVTAHAACEDDSCKE